MISTYMIYVYYAPVATLYIITDDWRLSSTPRLFHMTSVLGRFQVVEILPDQMRNGVVNPLLFNQAHLYEADQPGDTNFRDHRSGVGNTCTVLSMWVKQRFFD